jgi:general stress protein 26
MVLSKTKEVLMKNKPEGWDKAIALVNRVRFVYLSSLDEKGWPETRVLFNMRKVRSKPLSSGPAALGEGFANYLGTNTSSRKVSQLRKDDRACLYYSDNTKFEGCSVRGRIVEVKDPQIRKAVYAKSWDMYYPGGMDGGDFTLFRFEPESVRYYHGLKVLSFDA